VLIVFAHAMPHASRVNRAMRDAAQALPNVTVRDLYETYPDFHIDVPAEQALLAEADLVVFQHPIQWYGMPSLMKEWVDMVLEAGWAYGDGGTALRGKHHLLAVTTGSKADAYAEAGIHQWPFGAFLPPFRQTAQLCGMHWMPPLILHGAHQVPQAEVDAHVARFLHLLTSAPGQTTPAPRDLP
jgi:putative NADPH-quinone reductase